MRLYCNQCSRSQRESVRIDGLGLGRREAKQARAAPGANSPKAETGPSLGLEASSGALGATMSVFPSFFLVAGFPAQKKINTGTLPQYVQRRTQRSSSTRTYRCASARHLPVRLSAGAAQNLLSPQLAKKASNDVARRRAPAHPLVRNK